MIACIHHIFVYSEKAGRQTASPQKPLNIAQFYTPHNYLTEPYRCVLRHIYKCADQSQKQQYINAKID